MTHGDEDTYNGLQCELSGQCIIQLNGDSYKNNRINDIILIFTILKNNTVNIGYLAAKPLVKSAENEALIDGRILRGLL